MPVGIEECRDDYDNGQSAKDVASDPCRFTAFVRSALGYALHDVPRSAFTAERRLHGAVPSLFAEDAAENRVDVLGVVAQIELLADLLFRQRRAHVCVGEQFLEEILALFPDLHGVALD